MWTRWARSAAASLSLLLVVGVGGGAVESTQPDVVVVGDSLTAANVSLIRAHVEAGGVSSVRYAALSGRRIAAPVFLLGRRSSGIEEVRALRAQGVDPELWVVELGTNDIGSVKNCGCADPTAFAGDLIDRMVAEIGPGEPIAWVTLLDRSNVEVSEQFNAALRRRAAVDPLFTLIDWYGRGRDRPELFLDHVHHNLDGVAVFAEMYLVEFRRLLGTWLGPQPAGTAPAERLRYDGFSRADLAR